MIKVYFKQAWTLMKQNRLFTGIYVAGTGISIALVMTLFIIFYVKFAPIYPEYSRNRMLVINPVKFFEKGKPDAWVTINRGVTYRVIRDLLPGLPHLDTVCGVVTDWWSDNKVTLENGELLSVSSSFVDTAFWKVFSFRFLDGKPFSQADFESVSPVAVISESLARRLFATSEATGKRFRFNGSEFRVCGVVEDVSNATPVTAADLWLPMSHLSYVLNSDPERLAGNISAYLLATTAADKDALRREVQEVFHKANLQNKVYENDLMDQPDDYWVSTFRKTETPDLKEVVKRLLYILGALLFIPALNLSGMTSSRMGQRLCELGVRKAYGATNRQLVKQVLWENLLLTCLGGVFGLLLSYLIVSTASDWILTLFDDEVRVPGKSVYITAEMLFNPWVFISTFGVCILLNLVSALVPVWRALRRSIIQSLHTKR